jgi:glycine betaine/choline ABC-type transport system substrate-binding protein
MEGVGSPSFTEARFSEFMVSPDAQFAVDDLNSGAVDALAIRTASFGPLAKDLTALPDDDHVYPAQNVVPLYRTGVLDESADAENIKSAGVALMDASELTVIATGLSPGSAVTSATPAA